MAERMPPSNLDLLCARQVRRHGEGEGHSAAVHAIFLAWGPSDIPLIIWVLQNNKPPIFLGMVNIPTVELVIFLGDGLLLLYPH